MNTRFSSISIFVVIGLVPFAACDDSGSEPSNADCPTEDGPFSLDQSRISGSVEYDPPEEPLGRGDTLLITGTAFHEDGLAIREVRVAGALATRDAFNFGRWTATVSYEAVVSAAPTSSQGQVALTAVAVDACGVRYPFTSFVVPVDPTPDIDVATLTVSIEYPQELTFVAANGTAPAIITIAGTGRSVGAVVSVQVDSGELRGLDEAGQVVLAGASGQLANGSANLLFYGSAGGTATIVATVEDKLAVGLVRVAASPSLAPRTATLVAGSSISIEVSGQGDVTCSASVAPDLAITWSDATIDTEPTLIEPSESGGRELVATATLEPTADETEVVVTCSDAYGQTGTGRYRLGADPGFTEPEPDPDPDPVPAPDPSEDNP